MKLMPFLAAALLLAFVSQFCYAQDQQDASQQIKEIQKALDKLQTKLNALNKETSDGDPAANKDAGKNNNQVAEKQRREQIVRNEDQQPAPDKMREWLQQIKEELNPENRKHLEMILQHITAQQAKEPQVMRVSVQARPDGTMPGGQKPQVMIIRKQMAGQPMPDGFKPMEKIPQELMQPQGRGGWFAALPEPMRENAILWMFYILTHKPPMDGQPPMHQPQQPPQPGSSMPPQEYHPNAAGVPDNEMIQKMQRQIAERDEKIAALAKALEGAKGQGGNADEMEKRFNSKIEEMGKYMQTKQQEWAAAMEKAEARMKELNNALEESKKRNAEKEEIIAHQKERIGEMEKAIQELKAKIEHPAENPEPNN